MAELGQTTNPRELIPGDPEAIINDLRELVKNIEAIGATGDGLGNVDPGEWTGDAATAFRDVFTAEPPKWFQAVDTANQGGQTVADYADTLVWAQGEAQRAIEMYTEAQAASRAAAAQYNEQAQAASQAGETPSPFDDPGAAAAEEAQAVLDNARNEVNQAGDRSAGLLGFEPDGEGGYKRDLGGREWGSSRRDKRRVWDPETGQWTEKDPGGWQRHGRGSSWHGQWGSQSDGMLHEAVKDILGKLGIEIPESEWEASANVDVLGGELEGDFSSGDWSGSGRLEGSLLGAGAGASVNASALGIGANAYAEAYLAKGSAEGELNYGEHVTVSGSADAGIGAEVKAEGSIGVTGAQGSVGGFVGGEAGLQGSAEAGGVSVGAHGEVRYGIGAEASGQFGMGMTASSTLAPRSVSRWDSAGPSASISQSIRAVSWTPYRTQGNSSPTSAVVSPTSPRTSAVVSPTWHPISAVVSPTSPRTSAVVSPTWHPISAVVSPTWRPMSAAGSPACSASRTDGRQHGSDHSRADRILVTRGVAVGESRLGRRERARFRGSAPGDERRVHGQHHDLGRTA
ncbi:WXG100 family type VII secretion target [Saccharomonospora azurea]|uniref:WXG100 family type VII secretion target n=1 Tax=Saccharomonospora azurea TaxID=40988 RepID=UPI000319A38B|nr:hypothetical protein [Saccharomonospora azurea]